MKTTTVTDITSSKTGLLSRSRTLLLAALVIVSSAFDLRATGSVPFSGSAEGAIVSATPDTGGVVLRVLAEGYATQLGQFTREEVLLLNPTAGSIVGTIVFTAANGDKLSGLVAAQFTSPTTAVATYLFTGGTGRFENAIGEADALLSTTDGIHFTVDFEGSISSVGANKTR